MTSQKPCKVCKNAKSIVTTMGSQRFGVSETQYVCHFFLTLHSLWAPSVFFAPESISYSVMGAAGQVNAAVPGGTKTYPENP